MTIPRRQRLLGFAALFCAGLFLTDRFLLRPVTTWHRERTAEIGRLRSEQANAKALLERKPDFQARMAEYRQQAPPTDPSEAEQQLLASLRSWADRANVLLESVRPRRIVEKDRPPELEVRLSARGRLDGLTRLLYDLETAPRPIRVVKADINSGKRDRGELSLALELSMLLAQVESAAKETTQ